jgi:plasmid maintenance system killer protein
VTATRSILRLTRRSASGSRSGGRLEALKKNRKGQYSMRINDQWRICFTWAKDEPGPSNVEIVDYH